jgi:hypothetical protein
MKLFSALSRFGSSAKLDADVDDSALVKLGTLKGWLARLQRVIPIAGGGLVVRTTPDGDVWSAGADPPHPFRVTALGADKFAVLAGTCEGALIEAITLDVGSTRPVAILAYPQYELSIDSSAFVNAASVRGGGAAPILDYSTDILSDVTIVSSAGNEARALIAYITDGDVIAQITTGNIIGTFQDSGYLDGQMSGSFNKNA